MSSNEVPPQKNRRNVVDASRIAKRHEGERNITPQEVRSTETRREGDVETVYLEGRLIEATLQVGGLTGEECCRSLEQHGYTVTKDLMSYFNLRTFENNRRTNRETVTFVFVSRKELFPGLPFSQPEQGRSLIEINNAAMQRGLEPLSIDDGAHLAMALREVLRNYPVYFGSYTYAALSYGAILHHNGHDLYRVKAQSYFPRGGSTEIMVFRKKTT